MNDASRQLLGRGRLPLNVFSNVLVFCASVGYGLWLVPYLIRQVGPAAYGLVPLATSVTAYLSLITLGLNSSVSRLLTLAMTKGQIDVANRIFNTSLLGSLAVAGGLLPITLVGAKASSWLIRVPPGLEQDAQYLVSAAVGVFLLNTIRTPFAASAFLRNRFDLVGLVSIADLAVRVPVILIGFELGSPRLHYVGLGMVVGGLVSFAITVMQWRMLTPMLRLDPGAFEFGAMREMFATGGWVLINALGSLLFLNLDLVVINRVLGPDEAGRYGAMLQWPIMLRALAGAVAAVFTPTIMRYFAAGEGAKLIEYSRACVRWLGVCIGLPVGLICGTAPLLLELWLGVSYVPLWPLVILLTLPLSVNLSVLPLFSVQMATNRVKVPAVATLSLGVVHLVLALVLATTPGVGLYGVAVASAITLSAKNLVFTSVYGAMILEQPRAMFVKDLLITVAVTVAVMALGRLGIQIIGMRSWWALCTVGVTIGSVYLIAVIFVSAAARGLVAGIFARWKLRTPPRL